MINLASEGLAEPKLLPIQTTDSRASKFESKLKQVLLVLSDFLAPKHDHLVGNDHVLKSTFHHSKLTPFCHALKTVINPTL